MAILTLNKYRIKPTSSPRLPAAPVEYNQQYGDQLTNVLRLYFNEIDNVTSSFLGIDGGRYISFPTGSFYDTTSQTASANTPKVVTFNTTDTTTTLNVSVVSSSQVTVVYPGVYNFTFSAQLSNSSTSVDDTYIWMRVNGVDAAYSMGATTTPAKHVTTNGAATVGWNQQFSLNAGDYVQLVWMTVGGTTSLAPIAASVSPAYPASPSVALTVTFVSGPTS